MKKIVLASSNMDKLRELRYLLRDLDVELLRATDLIPGWTVEETGITLIENALLKSRDAAFRTGLPSIADDTGLFVDALGGSPGVYAARFAGYDCSYENNLNKLLRTILCEKNRKASFRTAAAFTSKKEEFTVMGEVKGRILDAPDGEGGFGYDPVFLPDALEHTFARCTPEEKHRVSHRAMAMNKLREELISRVIAL